VDAKVAGKRKLRLRRDLNHLHDDETPGALLVQPIDGRDIGMVQGPEELGLTLEAREAVGIGCELVGEHLDRNVAIELRITRPIHLAHAARTERFDDFEGAESFADQCLFSEGEIDRAANSIRKDTRGAMGCLVRPKGTQGVRWSEE